MSKADELKEVASALAYQRTVGVDNRVADIEKENAELKEQLDFIRDERNYFQEKCEDIELNYYCDHKGGCKVQDLEQQIEKMKSDVIKHFGEENNMLVARLLKEWELD